MRIDLFKKRPVVVIIRGAPSTGKTTVSFELRKRLPNSFIIGIDKIIAMNVSEKLGRKEKIREWGKMRSVGHELSDVLMSYLLKKRMNVIIEEVLPDLNRVKEVVKLAKSLGADSFVFELMAPLETIEKREKMRKDTNPEKPVKMIVDLLDKNPYPEATRIDTGKFSPTECAEKIIGIVEKSI